MYEKQKFSAGDRVLLTADKQVVQDVQGDSFVKRMQDYCGKPGVVQRVAVSNTHIHQSVRAGELQPLKRMSDACAGRHVCRGPVRQRRQAHAAEPAALRGPGAR